MVKQLNLFNQPSLNIRRDLKKAMKDAYKESGLSPEQVADRMNDLASRFGVQLATGRAKSLSKDMVDKWLNVNADGYLPGVNALVVYCAAVEDIRPMQVMLAPLGAEVISGADMILLQWAKESQAEKEARKRKTRLEKQL